MFGFISHAFHAVTHFVSHHWRQIVTIGAAVAVGVAVTIATGGLGAPLLLAAAAGGLAAGATGYTVGWLLSPRRPAWSWGGFAKATLVSGGLAVATAGLGEALSPVAGSVVSAVVPDAVASAVPDAVSSAVSNAAAGSVFGAGTQVVLNAVDGRPLGDGVGLSAIVGGGTGAVVGPVVESVVPRPVTDVPATSDSAPSSTPGIVNALDGLDGKPTPEEPTLPKEFSKTKWKTPPGELFGGGVAAANVTQGGLADCFLIASLASVADDQPGVIQNIIHLTPDGHYEVTLTNPRTGETTTTTLTSALPHQGNSPAFAGTSGSGGTQTSLWPAMLEKAYALSHGGYDGINNGGYATDALSALTGQPSSWLDVSTASADKVWATLQASDKNDWPTVVGTPKEGAVDPLVKNWHMYTFLGTETAQDGERFVILRNPWGYDPTPDGVFKMPFDGFMKSFNGINWVEYHAPPAN
ncbi:MAG TPA: C2 family cysteine protease [Planctomycetota bacterium]|nr:C2 family cysteine protease [Planctomycetota bacterium]